MEALADDVGVGDELVVLVEGEADERDEVGEDALPEPRTFERSSCSYACQSFSGVHWCGGRPIACGELLDLAERRAAGGYGRA